MPDSLVYRGCTVFQDHAPVKGVEHLLRENRSLRVALESRLITPKTTAPAPLKLTADGGVGMGVWGLARCLDQLTDGLRKFQEELELLEWLFSKNGVTERPYLRLEHGLAYTVASRGPALVAEKPHKGLS
eukprot:1160321-Pelagomonas_calceolata.AAC.13